MYVDWRTDLLEEEDDCDVLLTAGPRLVTETLTRAGIGNGMVAALYDDIGSSYAARAWWPLRVYGLDSARIMLGGLDRWRARGQPCPAPAEPPPPIGFTPRRQSRMRLTASDVKQLLDSPGV